MGWSNGSILSTSLITTYPSRYKVASVGAGDVEWISDWGNVSSANCSILIILASRRCRTRSCTFAKVPLFKMDKVQAPVLIFHGTADITCRHRRAGRTSARSSITAKCR